MNNVLYRRRCGIGTGTVCALTTLLMGLSHLASGATIPPGTQLAAQQTLVRNIGSEVETLDPNIAESVPAHTVTEDLFEGLTANDNHGAIVPGIAETWEQKDADTWIFHLRKNAKWSNGDSLVAGDFVYGMQRLVDPKTASPYATAYGVFLLNGLDVAAGKKPPSALGVRAIDTHTLEIKTPNPVPFLPALMANTNLGPINAAIVKKFGENWTKPGNIVSDGAYMLKSWTVNDRIVVVKNPYYWDAANVQLSQVTYLPVENEDTDVKMYQSGANDWVYELPPGSYERMKQQYPKEIHNNAMLGLRYFSLNAADPLLKDVRVREALSMVIDRDLLVKRVLADGQIPMYGLIVPGTIGADVTRYPWADWPMSKRVAEAKKLLSEAGVAAGTTLHIAYNTSEGNKRLTIFMASEWKSKLGLNAQVDAMEFRVLLKQRHTGQYQVARNGWIGDYNDASTFLTLVACHSDQNDSNYCDPKAQKLLDQASASNDLVLRSKLQTQAADAIMDGYPIIALSQYTIPRLVKPYVGGYTDDNMLDRFRGKDLYILKH
ncbi:peptide ABC transporter substrate-binding protein [Robbsia andropogonis]|nr:peptide ABC transporter substrate-binding protein [Robbsia andropogonis]MCP1117589.1 peptide ABC transporter substrate-binding protein [Robbsia andropogonis]MCP1127055.1 peptide ABC transporter substrate-binding protein [Robbsia andropogonis]